MSNISNLTSRARSSSTSRQAFKHQMPEELQPRLCPKKPSGIRIEDKLMNYQANAKKRLELLKMNTEQEKLKDLQDKPKILKKSKILAEIHDKKLLGDRNPVKEMPKIENFCSSRVENCEKSGVAGKITVESIPFSCSDASPDKKRAKSLANFSLCEKDMEIKDPCTENLIKVNGVNEKLVIRFEDKAESKGKGCGKIETDHKFFKDDVLTPQSIETYADSVEHQVRPNKKKTIKPRNLGPYQVRVSFECGLDLESFMKRGRKDS